MAYQYFSVSKRKERERVSEAEYFDITKQGTFFIDIKPCYKIEELTDSFMTRESLELMNSDNPHWEYNSRIFLGAEIREACEEWTKLIPDGCQSTTQTTPKIRTMIRELNPAKIRDYFPSGFTCRGDRIINKERRSARIQEMALEELERNKRLREAKAAAPYERADYVTRRDMNHISEAFDRMLGEEYGMECSRRYRYASDEKSIFTFYKRLCGWDAIAKYHRKYHTKKKYLQDLKYMKKLWDDPSLEP